MKWHRFRNVIPAKEIGRVLSCVDDCPSRESLVTLVLATVEQPSGMAMQHFLSQLAECRDTSELLERTLARAIALNMGVKTLRYYRLRRINKEEHLVSVDGAGHDDYVTAQLRLGAIRIVRRKPNEVRQDGSFEVMGGRHARPFVFQINPDLTSGPGIREVHLAPLTFYELRDDRCDRWLGEGRLRDAWVDVPLRLGGRTLGKLSCSLATGRIDTNAGILPKLAAGLMKFQAMAAYLTPFLESLRGLEVNSPLEEAGREIFSSDSYEKLYRYCTNELIRLYPFDYESADVLVVARDTLKYYEYAEDRDDSELLILRGSSREDLNIGREVHTSFYRRDPGKPRAVFASDRPGESGSGLTPWVWRKGKSLRLNYDPDDPKFEQQLRAYDKDAKQLTWVEHIKAGKDLKSLLIVPIPAPTDDGDKGAGPRPPLAEEGEWAGRRIIGVIRFANKRNGYIEPREEVLLQRIAERCLGPKMMSLRHETFALSLRDKLDKLNLVRLDAEDADAPAANDPAMEEVVAQTLRTFLGDMHGKLALLNIRTGVDKFRSIPVGGDLIDPQEYKREFSVSDTLTGYLVGGNRQPYVFLNDLGYARKRGHYASVVTPDPARCALASTIQFGDDVFGGFVLLSREYDILPTSHGRLVQVLAGQLGFLLARRAALEFASCIKGLRHDTQHLILPMRQTLHLAKAAPLADEQEARAQAKLDFWYDTIYTHCRTGPKRIEDFVNDCSNPIDVRRKVELAADRAWEVVAQPGTSDRPAVRIEPTVRFEARVCAPYLTICAFNLLKNAWESCNCGEVAVSLASEGGYLLMRVTNQCMLVDADRLPRLRSLLGEGLPPSVRSVMFETKSDGVGLRLVQRLAEWHRLPDPDARTRRGLLEVESPDDRVVHFTLRLPTLPSEN